MRAIRTNGRVLAATAVFALLVLPFHAKARSGQRDGGAAVEKPVARFEAVVGLPWSAPERHGERWIPACAGMTIHGDSRRRGNDDSPFAREGRSTRCRTPVGSSQHLAEVGSLAYNFGWQPFPLAAQGGPHERVSVRGVSGG